MIPIHKYAAWRTIVYEGTSRQRFRKLCRELEKQLPDYYDGLSGDIADRRIAIKVAKYAPTEEQFIAEAQKRNESLADDIINKLRQLVENNQLV